MIVSQTAPAFTAQAAQNGQIKTLSLSDYKGRWVVLLFYPLDFTFVCPTELHAFSDASEEFGRANTQILGISVDSVYSHLAWDAQPRNKGGLGGLKVPLVEDLTKDIARAYDVLMDDGKALRGAFIIDDHGVVQAALINNLDVGRSAEEALRLVQAYQHAAKTGSVCPANWKPGAKDMQADPEKSKAYFATLG
jgi:alkyl hydroperoxide reductase subunit AhpC